MSELSRLMVKAVRSLPAEEQDALLEAMLEPRLAPWPGPGGPGLPSPADLLAGQSPRSTGSTARTLATSSPSRRSAPRPAGPGRASRSASPPTSTSASSSGARPTASPWPWCSAAWSRASSTTRRPGPPAPPPPRPTPRRPTRRPGSQKPRLRLPGPPEGERSRPPGRGAQGCPQGAVLARTTSSAGTGGPSAARGSPRMAAEHGLGGLAADLVAVEADGGERRVEAVGHGHVVVADDRDVPGAVEPGVAQGADRPHGHGVVVGEHGGGLARVGQGRLHQPPALGEHRPAGRRDRPGLEPEPGRGGGEAVVAVLERLHVQRAREAGRPGGGRARPGARPPAWPRRGRRGSPPGSRSRAGCARPAPPGPARSTRPPGPGRPSARPGPPARPPAGPGDGRRPAPAPGSRPATRSPGPCGRPARGRSGARAGPARCRGCRGRRPPPRRSS